MSKNEHLKCGWPFYKISPSNTSRNSNELLLIADCVSNVYTNFYQDFIQEKNSNLICPKLDNSSQCVNKLASLIKTTSLQKIIIIRMEYTCCGYLSELVKKALTLANKTIPITEKVINQKGKVAVIRKNI